MSTELKRLIESEIRKALNEVVTEPSEQILRGAVDTFRQQTGVNVATPVLVSKDDRYNTSTYEVSLNKEIRTNIMKALFKSLTLQVVASPILNSVGSFSFIFRYKFSHPGKKTEMLESGSVLFKNNKYTFEF